jgi:adenine deaminase
MIKRLFKFLIFIVGLLIVTSAAALFIDSQRTQYLMIDKSKKSATDSYLITHVNIIPMNQDTVLKNKMVYIKQGVIDQIADSLMVKGVEVVNAKNKFLSPGLIDMHIHLWDRYELGLYLTK